MRMLRPRNVQCVQDPTDSGRIRNRSQPHPQALCLQLQSGALNTAQFTSLLLSHPSVIFQRFSKLTKSCASERIAALFEDSPCTNVTNDSLACEMVIKMSFKHIGNHFYYGIAQIIQK